MLFFGSPSWNFNVCDADSHWRIDSYCIHQIWMSIRVFSFNMPLKTQMRKWKRKNRTKHTIVVRNTEKQLYDFWRNRMPSQVTFYSFNIESSNFSNSLRKKTLKCFISNSYSENFDCYSYCKWENDHDLYH